MVSKRRLTDYAELLHFKKILYINFETKDNHGKTPFMKSYIKGHKEVVKYWFECNEIFHQVFESAF